ncbi:hypothetical protein TWF696_008451 [Orbilia brochopaga]|uniref:Cytochrome P450 n=1 Tax=Orbilia brochopaga TaxID=3140254 RepID=A0AAV9ULH9_9PEZI
MDPRFRLLNGQQLLLAFVGVSVCYLLAKAIYRIYLSPLSKIPGPWYTAASELWFIWKNLGGGSIFAIHDLHQKYGPYVRIAPNTISTADLESVQKIHSTSDVYRKSEYYEKLRREVDTLPVITDLESYRHRRRAYGSAFSNSTLSLMEPAIRRNVDKLIRKIQQVTEAGEKFDLLKWFHLLSLDVLGELCYGLDFGMLQDEKVHPLVEDALSFVLLVTIRAYFPIVNRLKRVLSYVPHPKIQRFLRVEDRVYTFSSWALSNTQHRVHNCKDGKSKITLFSKILDDMNDPDVNVKTKMTMAMVRQEALMIVAAASDTTAITGTFLIWVILRHAEIRRKLVDELRAVTAGSGELDGGITDEKLKQLPYLKVVIMEVMRLYCAGQIALERVVPSGGRQIGPYFLPEETRVCSPIYTLHRDPTVFPDPELFKPERWINPTKSMEVAMLHFGGQSRPCIGQNLAMTELRLLVAGILSSCPDIELADSCTDDSMEVVDHLLINPKSHKCEVQKRKMEIIKS